MMDLRQFIPFPELESCKSILCIQPHPDDNEIGAGATIAKLIKAGCAVTYLTVTDGSMGTTDPGVDRAALAQTRRAEVLAAAQVLGVGQIRSLDYPDGGPYDEREMARRIARVIRETKPEIVMVPDPFLPYEGHPDHRKVGLAATEACLFCPFPHFYNDGEDSPARELWAVSGVAYYFTAMPNTYVGVDETFPVKLAALKKHISQYAGGDLQSMEQYLTMKAMEYGQKSGYTYAEAFKVLPPLLLHCNVDIDV